MTPNYYGGEKNPYEVVKVINALGLNFELGNVLKYIARAGKKNPETLVEDLKKAKRYIELEIQKHDNTIQERPNVAKDNNYIPFANNGVLYCTNDVASCKGGVLCEVCSPESCVRGNSVTIQNIGT